MLFMHPAKSRQRLGLQRMLPKCRDTETGQVHETQSRSCRKPEPVGCCPRQQQQRRAAMRAVCGRAATSGGQCQNPHQSVTVQLVRMGFDARHQPPDCIQHALSSSGACFTFAEEGSGGACTVRGAARRNGPRALPCALQMAQHRVSAGSSRWCLLSSSLQAQLFLQKPAPCSCNKIKQCLFPLRVRTLQPGT